MRSQITLAEIAAAAVTSLRSSMFHCMPGVVQTWNAPSASVPATVDVLPAVNNVLFDPDTGARESETWELVANVPIAYPRFGGYTMQGPMRAGDRVLLVAFDLDPTAHRSSGGREDPADTRRHGGNYWWAMPCDITDAGALKDGSAAASGLVIGVDGGQPQIRINGSAIQLGATGGDSVALARSIDAVFSALKSLCTTLGGGAPIVVGSSGIPEPILTAAANAVESAIPATVGSALVKAQ